MIANRAIIGIMFLAAGCLGLGSCMQECKNCSEREQETTSIQEMDSLRVLAARRHHQPFRKPAQDERARALRQLSQKAD